MAATKTKLRAQADAIREQLQHPELYPDIFDDDEPGHRYDDPESYAIDAAPLADKLALLVAQYMDPAQQAQELLERNGSGTLAPAASRAAHAEYSALVRLLQSKATAQALIDPTMSATAAVHASFAGKFMGNAMDFPSLAAAIKDQAAKVAGGDRATIRATMSTIALVVQQVGLGAIAQARGAATVEARSYATRQGVTMLCNAFTLLERLDRIDEADPATVVNIAKNQQIIEHPPTARKTRNARNRLNGTRNERLDSGAASEILPSHTRAEDVGAQHRPPISQW